MAEEKQKKMRRYTLQVEFQMNEFPDSQDFQECVLESFMQYCKKHPSVEIVAEWLHLGDSSQTLVHKRSGPIYTSTSSGGLSNER